MCESDSCILQFLNELNLTYRRLTGFVASFYSIQKCWCLGAGFHCVTLLSDLFRLSGIRSQSWLWVAWPRDHDVRIACSGSGPINALEAECSGKLKASMARAGCDEGSVDSRRCLHHWWDSYKSFRGEAGQRGNVPEWENRVCSYYVKKKNYLYLIMPAKLFWFCHVPTCFSLVSNLTYNATRLSLSNELFF